MKRRLPSKKKCLYLESFPVPRDRRPVLCQPLFSPALRRKKEVLAAPELVLAQRDRLKDRYNTREMFCKCFQHLSCRNKEHQNLERKKKKEREMICKERRQGRKDRRNEKRSETREKRTKKRFNRLREN